MVDIDDFEYRKARRDLHEAVNQLRKMEGKEPIPWAEPMPPYCSFCGKNKNEIQNIIESESAATLCANVSETPTPC